VLRQYKARATFFLVSSHVSGREAIVSTIVSEGHELGNHMTRDEPSVRLSPQAFERSLREAGDTIGRFAPVRWFRPGSGWYTPAMVSTAERAGYRCALGSIYPLDAQLPSPAFAAAFILANARPGAVIILHDGDARGGRTVATLQRVLPELRKRGLRVVSLSDLDRMRTVPP
jgi:peptidoglycan/xylan/chitin deacetylase (PgdA/CDA1 family)